MTADISQIKLHSEFFAKLVKAHSPIGELKDGTVYVKTNNESNWNAAVCRAKDSFANCRMRSSWLIEYDIDILPEELYSDKESAASSLLGTSCNIIMPIFLPDRMEQYYFVGSISAVEDLEPAASLLSTDAQSLITACLPYAISAMEETDLTSILQGICHKGLKDEWAEEAKQLIASIGAGLSFRGMQAALPSATFGDVAKAVRAIKKGLVSYEDRKKLIMELPRIVKKLKSEDSDLQEQCEMEYAQAIEALGERGRRRLLDALIKEAKQKDLKKHIAAIADRETLGSNTKYKIAVKPYEERFKELGYDYNFKNCLFIADGETLHPVRMSKSSMAIYIMTLIEKVTKQEENAIVDVKSNKEAFKEVYKLLFDFNEKDIQERFNKLIYRDKDKKDVPTRTGRLSECYGDIEASLQYAFKDLDEDYSPFLANSTTPLAINADKIVLPEDFKKVANLLK